MGILILRKKNQSLKHEYLFLYKKQANQYNKEPENTNKNYKKNSPKPSPNIRTVCLFLFIYLPFMTKHKMIKGKKEQSPPAPEMKKT